MAIMDAVAAMMGTAQTNRQPVSGVEEQISCVIKPSTSDGFSHFDGSGKRQFAAGGLSTSIVNKNSTSAGMGAFYNCALMITNAIYIQKEGTSDVVTVMGTQTNT